MITNEQLFIGGEWTTPSSAELLDIRSPHDQSRLGRAAQALPADVDRAVAAARKAFDKGPWPRTSPAERIAVIRRLVKLREERADEIAALISAENGSALWFTKAGRPGLTRQANAYLKAAEEFGWEETLEPSDPAAPFRSVVRREAVGVVAAIIPWNSPFSSAMAKILPALLAGNTVVLKVSPENTLSMNLLADLLAQTGLPEGVISVLPADRETSEHLVKHPGVDKIAFTGSTRAGRRIASLAGAQLKRVSLELGGKSAMIILPDADLDAAIQGVKFSSLLNNAESCIAQTRILAPRARYDEVVAGLTELVESLGVGDPAQDTTFIGPMVRRDQQQRVLDYIRTGIEEGARLVTGGPEVPAGLENGFYVTPTLFADVDNSMRVAQEEIFGPVLVVIAYEDEDDAVRIANDSEYGLSGGVWSADPAHALEVARRVRTGTITVNGAPIGFDGPFGGFKASGLGREYGAVGLGTYTEYKTVTIPVQARR
ncbi:aldehyde dehydrogenase [Amycolatopsis thermoflava]|uniref:Acyl-CoA reductase-like NAD-dependent aldehyde dehydrogenase n=1 Tax=Amycolatopsis thermoflava TaxID=84480 RepID=A0A3N2GPQ0_9PSEU|nr:aldehyde dehydrogenase [Amycolatopsis thermoflava]ROS38606.1 acyl-CoA reductase-like NAD-dependent aldehyde dehydrogenase [Amycolatopsis thermoflava]